MNFKKEVDSIAEQIRLHSITERTKALNERKQSQPVIITVPANAASGGGKGPVDNTVNNYVVDGYVENYFE
jgi:hypothetical protein